MRLTAPLGGRAGHGGVDAAASRSPDPAWHTPDACSRVAPDYTAPAELPWIYSSIQVVLDKAGLVSAFVHVGESVAETRVALKPGGTLASLPLSAV